MLKSPSTYGYNSTLFLETSPPALILKPCRQKLFPSLLYQSINSDIQKQSYEAISNPFMFFLLIQFIFHIRRRVPTNNTRRGFLSGLVVAQLCPSLISWPDPKIPAQFLTIQLFRLSIIKSMDIQTPRFPSKVFLVYRITFKYLTKQLIQF